MKKSYKTQCLFGQELSVEHSLRAYSVFRPTYNGPDLQEFFAHPDAVIQSHDAVVLKDGNSQTVVMVRMDGRDTVVKRYNLKTPWHRLRRVLRTTRARVSWQSALRLEELGVRSPAPVAMLEARAGVFRGCSYFLSEYSQGRNARNWFLDPNIDLDAKRVVAERVIEIFSTFAKNQIVHGDTKASNFLIDGQVPLVIDLDVMCECTDANKYQTAHERDITRFMRNWEESPEIDALFRSGMQSLL